MKLDPGIHIVMHSVFLLKPGVTSGNGPTAYGIDDRRSRLASLRHPTTPVECGKDTLLDADDARCDNSIIAIYVPDDQ